MFHSISIFTGRLHPLLVHLPIGCLLMALLLWYMSGRPRWTALAPAVPVVLLVGVITAVFSCITGLILSSSGEYDSGPVITHMWMGIATALASAWWYSQVRSAQPRKIQGYTGLALLALIFITGHLGGTLTHGENYLIATETKETRRPPVDMAKAKLFDDLITPIFEDKCFNCHGPSKQKGKLRLDKAEFVQQGGKHGSLVIAGKPEESELIKRITLPLEDEHHMSPKEKSQLTKSEISLLRWWIAQGASYTNLVSATPQPDSIKAILTTPAEAEQEETVNDDIPSKEVAAAAEKDIAALRAKGAVVLPVAQNSHYLEIYAGKMTDANMKLITALKDQVISLKLSGSAITDASIKDIAQCTHLVRLHLDHTALTGDDFSLLAPLQQLKYLNLVASRVSNEGLKQLKDLKSLQRIYLYRTAVDRKAWRDLQSTLKGVKLDSGGYVVPLLPEDTQVVKPATR